jgi:hypothetical protein
VSDFDALLGYSSNSVIFFRQIDFAKELADVFHATSVSSRV